MNIHTPCFGQYPRVRCYYFSFTRYLSSPNTEDTLRWAMASPSYCKRWAGVHTPHVALDCSVWEGPFPAWTAANVTASSRDAPWLPEQRRRHTRRAEPPPLSYRDVVLEGRECMLSVNCCTNVFTRTIDLALREFFVRRSSIQVASSFLINFVWTKAPYSVTIRQCHFNYRPFLRNSLP